MTAPPLPREVNRAFRAVPAPIGKRLLEVHALVFATAAAHKRPFSFNCKTTLIDTFRERFPDRFEYPQARALPLPASGKPPKRKLSACLALTYQLGVGHRKCGDGLGDERLERMMKAASLSAARRCA